jgi:hypothetical protein
VRWNILRDRQSVKVRNWVSPNIAQDILRLKPPIAVVDVDVEVCLVDVSLFAHEISTKSRDF